METSAAIYVRRSAMDDSQNLATAARRRSAVLSPSGRHRGARYAPRWA